MKHLYHIFIGFIILFIAVSCLDDPDGEGGIMNAKAPEVETDATDIKVTATTIELAGKVVRENGRQVFERGFLYGTESPLSFSNAKKWVDEGEGKGSFSGVITELVNDTVYYVCAYAMNDNSEQGRSQGEEVSVRTITGLGVVRTLPVTTLDATSAKAEAKIENPGEGDILSRGFYLSFGSVKDSIVYSQETTDRFSYQFSGLTPNTEYSVKAFVKNHFGVVTGTVQKFTTTSGLPKLMPELMLSADFVKASLTATIAEEGDAPVTSFGFYWGAMHDEQKEKGDTLVVESKNPDGTFTGSLSGLVSGERYYVLAFATNAFGTSCTPDTFFVTKSDEPVVTLQSCTLDEEKGCLVLKGRVDSHGIDSVKKVGFCYDTKPSPTVQNGKVVEAKLTEDNQFEATLYLRGGISYSIRAFATNSQATGYSNVYAQAIPAIFETQKVQTSYNKMPGTVASFTYGSRCYLLGGDDPKGPSNELWVYNKYDSKLENTGTNFLSGGRKHQAVAGTGERLFYVYGGYANGEAKREFHSYDASRPTWKRINIPENGPDSLYLATACMFNNDFFLIGGINKHESITNEVWMYSDENWSKQVALPQAQSGGISVVVNNTIYAGMGETSAGGSTKKLWSMSATDRDQWTEEATMSDNNNAIRSGVVLHGVLYVVDTSGVIWSYDPASDATAWSRRSKLPNEIANDVHTMFVLDDTIHFGFGSTGMIVTYHPVWDHK